MKKCALDISLTRSSKVDLKSCNQTLEEKALPFPAVWQKNHFAREIVKLSTIKVLKVFFEVHTTMKPKQGKARPLVKDIVALAQMKIYCV